MSDLISKRAAVRRISELLMLELHGERLPTWNEVYGAIQELPSAEPKTGHWKYVNHHGERYRVCPFCNAERKDDKSTGWNFCPHCGADMIGEKNE